VVVARDLHHPVVDLLDHRRSHRYSPAPHGLGVGHLGATHAGEVAVHQIGPHFAFQHPIAPIAHVLEHQQTQHHLGRSAASAAGAALGMPLGQGLVDGRHDFLVRQYLIGVFHPVFVQILHFVGDQTVTKGALRPPRLNHGFSSRVSASSHPAAVAHD
jgi:hypothetical protein